MARINIEDSLFKDSRYFKLVLKVGDEHKALGLVTMAWMIAQKNWLKHGHVPANAWPKELNVLVEVELANVRSDGSVYVKGSKRAFKWLDQKSEAGQRISEKKKVSLEKARSARWNKTASGLNGSERDLNGSEAPSPTLSPSPPLSPVQPQTQEEEKNPSDSFASNLGNPKSPPIRKSKKVQEFNSAKEVIEAIPKATREVWKELYHDPEFLQREALRAWHYYAVQNPKKLPKSLGGWSRVLSYWFDKNWVKHVKGVPTRRMTNSENNQQSLQDLYDKVQREGT